MFAMAIAKVLKILEDFFITEFGTRINLFFRSVKPHCSRSYPTITIKNCIPTKLHFLIANLVNSVQIFFCYYTCYFEIKSLTRTNH